MRRVSRTRAGAARADTLALPDFLAAASRARWAHHERATVRDAAVIAVEQAYVHLRQKRARYGIDPLAALAAIDLDSDGRAGLDAIEPVFQIFASLRDLHTSFVAPPRLARATAALPLLVEGHPHRNARRYLATKVADPGLLELGLTPGVEVTHWNGVPIDLAVARHAVRTRGANPAAAWARSIDGLCVRPLGERLPPDEHWVQVTFLDTRGAQCSIDVPWTVRTAPATGGDLPSDARLAGVDRLDLAVDASGRAAQVAKRELYTRGSSEQVDTALPEIFRPEIRRLRRAERGYLRIWSFMHSDDGAVLDELAAILDRFHAEGCRGVIVDIRSNPGGVIPTAERLLQLLTPTRPIHPTRFAFAPTPLTRQVTATDPQLRAWHDSIAAATGTGEPYSRALPITDPAAAADRDPATDLPLVLIVDAMSYSSADLFAAGWEDHGIGPIVGTSQSTGAGGANVWTYQQLQARTGAEGDLVLPVLPRGAGMRVAVRRALRTREREGTPIEDIGIQIPPEHVHAATRNDLLHRNEDLLRFAAARLPS